MDNRKLPTNKNKILGVSMVETIIALPVLLLMGLGCLQMIFLYEAKAVINHAAFMAARAGAMNNMDFDAMYNAFNEGVTILERDPAVRADRNRVTGRDIATIYVANPTLEVFNSTGNPWGQVISGGGGKFQIPNENLLARDPDEIRNGVSILDANLLRIRVIYNFELIVPVVRTILFSLIDQGQVPPGETTPFYPLTAVATVRMQSSAIFDQINQNQSDEKTMVLSIPCVSYLADHANGNRAGCPESMFPTDDTLDHNLQIF